jgi:hypothetical protein
MLNLFIMDLIFSVPIKLHLACVLLHVVLTLGELPLESIQIMNCAGIPFSNLKASFNIVLPKETNIIKQLPITIKDYMIHQEKRVMPINCGIKHATAHHE